ncbi:MAG: adenylate kinase [bacterium]
MQIVLLGAPGVGKGTQASFLAKEQGIPHVSAGDILRQEMRSGTRLGNEAKEFVTQGKLVPDELIVNIIKNTLKEKKYQKGFILDGFPRTIVQAKALDDLLKELDKKISVAINIDVSVDEIVKRLSGRRVCESCKENFHVEFKPPKEVSKCDRCGGMLIVRDDDKPETIKNRLEVYQKMTEPLIGYYGEKGFLENVSGNKDILEIKRSIEEVIKKRYGDDST